MATLKAARYTAHAMRYLIAGMLCLSILSASAEDGTLNTDGTWWKGLSRQEKLLVAIGYTDGYVAGSFSGELAQAVALADPKHAPPFIPAKRLPDSAADITFATLIDGVDKCYSDFRNRNLDVRFCVHWVVRGVRGDSDANLASYLVDARKNYTHP